MTPQSNILSGAKYSNACQCFLVFPVLSYQKGMMSNLLLKHSAMTCSRFEYWPRRHTVFMIFTVSVFLNSFTFFLVSKPRHGECFFKRVATLAPKKTAREAKNRVCCHWVLNEAVHVQTFGKGPLLPPKGRFPVQLKLRSAQCICWHLHNIRRCIFAWCWHVASGPHASSANVSNCLVAVDFASRRKLTKWFGLVSDKDTNQTVNCAYPQQLRCK